MDGVINQSAVIGWSAIFQSYRATDPSIFAISNVVLVTEQFDDDSADYDDKTQALEQAYYYTAIS